MALTSTTVFDIVGQTQTITFTNPTQIDQIVYSSNAITFETTAGYNLVKSDLLLYLRFIQVFNTLLYTNFPTVSFGNLALPNSALSITKSFAGVTHLNYAQSSLGTNVLDINYVPTAGSGAITARGSPVTITIQEFVTMVTMLNIYSNQVNLN